MLIEVSSLCKTYTTYERGTGMIDTVRSLIRRKTVRVEALRGIDLSVDSGDLVALFGPNGAGKSTTIKILTGVLHPTSGDVRVMGYVPWKERARYVATIGAVFGQKSQLIWDIPPMDSFHLNKAIYQIPATVFRRNVESMVEKLGVGAVVRKPTRQLSLGERMKCEFIMATLHEPQIIFLDEPTIGLDIIAKDSIRNFILERNRAGVTFILTTHDLGDVEHLARRTVVINHGSIVFDDTLSALRHRIKDRRNIRVSTRATIDFASMPGVTIVDRLSPFEAVLELDPEIHPLNEFIAGVNAEGTIVDLSIGDTPIEEIIKDLYSPGP